MIDKLSYDEILGISADLKQQIDVIEKMTASRDITQLSSLIKYESCLKNIIFLSDFIYYSYTINSKYIVILNS